MQTAPRISPVVWSLNPYWKSTLQKIATVYYTIIGYHMELWYIGEIGIKLIPLSLYNTINPIVQQTFNLINKNCLHACIQQTCLRLRLPSRCFNHNLLFNHTLDSAGSSSTQQVLFMNFSHQRSELNWKNTVPLKPPLPLLPTNEQSIIYTYIYLNKNHSRIAIDQPSKIVFIDRNCFRQWW